MSAVATALLDDRLQAFGSLVGLLLALITLFTAQRWSAVKGMGDASEGTRLLRAGGWVLDLLLLLLTLGLFASGLPLVLDAAGELEPMRATSALRSAFVIVWIALAGLIVWQLALIHRSVHLARNPPPRTGR